MFEQTRDALKNRNKTEKKMKARQREEIRKLNIETSFRAMLGMQLHRVSALLNTKDVKSIIITVDDSNLALFSKSIYSEEMAEYNVKQMKNQSNKFKISKKYIVV